MNESQLWPEPLDKLGGLVGRSRHQCYPLSEQQADREPKATRTVKNPLNLHEISACFRSLAARR